MLKTFVLLQCYLSQNLTLVSLSRMLHRIVDQLLCLKKKPIEIWNKKKTWNFCDIKNYDNPKYISLDHSFFGVWWSTNLWWKSARGLERMPSTEPTLGSEKKSEWTWSYLEVGEVTLLSMSICNESLILNLQNKKYIYHAPDSKYMQLYPHFCNRWLNCNRNFSDLSGKVRRDQISLF